MCTRTTCRVCNKPTWTGCGQHKEMVLAGVPKGQRCKCTAADIAAWRAANKRPLFGKLFSRK
ncbi:MAG: hypothetical protein ACYC3W_01965 [Candidatus Nanopelagicales bacterium]